MALINQKQQQAYQVKNNLLETSMRYLKNWYVFVLCIGMSLGAAYAYLAYSTPQYKVSSTLLIQDDVKGDAGGKGTAFSDLNMFHISKTVDNEMEVLRSRDLIFNVLKSLSMDIHYMVEGKIKDKELYGKSLPVRVVVYKLNPGAYAQILKLVIKDNSSFTLESKGRRVLYRFDQLIKTNDYLVKIEKGPSFSANFSPVIIQFKDLYRMAEAYSLSGLTVLPIAKDANTIVLSLLDPIPQRGVDILNKLIENYNRENVNTKNIMAGNTIRFIDNRLKYLTNDLSVVEGDVEKYKRLNRVTDINADAQINLQNSGNYDQQLSTSSVQLNLIRSLERYLGQADGRYQLVPSTLGLKDQTLSNLIDKYNDLQVERQRLMRYNRPNNPLVLNINDQLAGLKSNIKENLKNVRRGLTLERNSLQSKSSQYESVIRNVPGIERGLQERSREQSVKVSLYQYLLQKREETALSLSSTIPTSQIIDRPAYNTAPAKPKTTLIYICSLLGGFLLPFSILYVKDKLNTKVQDISDVELSFGTRILGELSHNEERKTSIVVQKGSRTTISELFRYIRSNLGLMNDTVQNQVLLITSGMKGEGKTFFCINLGITLAMVDKKVVILEFDLRKPDLLKDMNIKQEKGLTDYLIDPDIELNQVIKPSNIAPNLYVIGCGTLPDNPSELLMSYKIGLLFEKLRKEFDYIIVDTSPVGQVADAFSIAPYTDAGIYLIRYNYTEKMQLGILEDISENKKLKNLMLVFNDAKKENRKAYVYGGYGLQEMKA